MPKRNGIGIELLADPTRRRIIALLALRPRHASAIAEAIGLSRPATTRQLHLLEAAGLVRRSWITRDGRRRLFAIELQAIGPIAAWLAGVELDRRRSECSYAPAVLQSDVASPPIAPFGWNDPTAALQGAREKSRLIEQRQRRHGNDGLGGRSGPRPRRPAAGQRRRRCATLGAWVR